MDKLAMVIVKSSETLGKHEYLIPLKERKKELSNVLKSTHDSGPLKKHWNYERAEVNLFTATLFVASWRLSSQNRNTLPHSVGYIFKYLTSHMKPHYNATLLVPREITSTPSNAIHSRAQLFKARLSYVITG